MHRYRELEQEVRREAEARERRGMAGAANGTGDAMAAMQQEQATDDTRSGRARHEFVSRLGQENAEARLARAIASPRQLEEVMVEFWFDHFNVFDVFNFDYINDTRHEDGDNFINFKLDNVYVNDDIEFYVGAGNVGNDNNNCKWQCCAEGCGGVEGVSCTFCCRRKTSKCGLSNSSGVCCWRAVCGDR